MTQGVGKVLHHGLGHAGGAAGEEHQHPVLVLGHVRPGGGDKFGGGLIDQGLKVQPAFGDTGPYAHAVVQNAGVLFGGMVDGGHAIGIVDRHDEADVGGLHTVEHIFGGQLVAGGDEHHAQLVTGQR